VTRVLLAAGVMPKTQGKILVLLNIKDVIPTKTIGNSPWNMAEIIDVQEYLLTNF
jgi:hypothetical protein